MAKVTPEHLKKLLEECLAQIGDLSMQVADIQKKLDNLPVSETAAPKSIPLFSNQKSNNPDEIPLDFGKYRGIRPIDLLDRDPQYLMWIYEQTERTNVSDALYTKAGGVRLRGNKGFPPPFPPTPSGSQHFDDYADDDIPF